MKDLPEELFDFAFIPGWDEKLDQLAELAEPENWDYQFTDADGKRPILANYLRHTYKRLAREEKVELANNGQNVTFNTGLVTPSQEPIYALFNQNRKPDAKQPWYFQRFVRRGEADLNSFDQLPEMAHYFDDPAVLVFDHRKDFRVNVEHIVSENKERFPEPYCNMDEYVLQTLLKGSIDNARERVRRNYKTAVPNFYRGKVQLMLPLCISNAAKADLALVIEDHNSFYRAATCLMLDWAYGNARLLAKPDKEWLQP